MDKPISLAPPSSESPWLPLLARAVSVAGQLSELAARHDAVGNAPDPGFPEAEFALLAGSGLLAGPVPRRFGGGGLNGVAGGTLTLLQLLRHVGRGSLPTGRIYEGHVNAHALVEQFGTEEQQARAAQDTVRDGRIFGVWNAEEPPEVALKLFDLGHGRYRFEGGKFFCSGLGRVTRPIIGGRWDGPGGGWQMCLVPMDEIAARTDHAWWQPLGMESTVSGAIDLTGIELSRDTLLGAPDDYYREPGFNGGAIRFAAVQLGGAEALYDAARAYLQTARRTDHPSQRIRAAELAMRLETGDGFLRGAAAVTERLPQAPWEIAVYAGMTRLAVESICLDTIRTVERTVGARGLMRPYPFARMIRDLTMYLRQPAPDAVLDRVGRHVLDHPGPAHQHWPKTPAEASASQGEA